MPDLPPRRRPDAATHDDAAATHERIGRFRLVSRLGQGAMGEVWSAYDPQLDRRVALKRIRGTSGSARQQRLLREAQALARLSHPHVVQVFEAGVHEGEVYIAMEQIDGPTLRAWLGERTHGWRDRLAICVQAGRGLAAAHAVGLVHRDFKPDNVLLGRASVEQPWRARVADFGLARADEETTPNDDGTVTADDPVLCGDLTETGAVLGTPAYMAPEQFLGTTVEAKSDQFALCVVLFEALYGTRPFAGATRMALAHAITTGAIADVPEARGVPSWMHAVVVRGLAVDPDARHPSIDDLLAALSRDPGRRRRRVLASTALVAGIGGLAWAVVDRDAADPCAHSATRLDDVWNPTRRAALGDHLAALTASREVPRGALEGIDAYANAWIAGHHDACVATHERGEQTPAMLDRRMECLATRRDALAVTIDVLGESDARAITRLESVLAGLPALASCEDTELLDGQTAVPRELQPAVAAIEQQLARVRATIRSGRVDEGRALADVAEAAARSLGHAPLHATALMERGRAEVADDAPQLARDTLEEAHYTALAEHNDEVAIRSALSLIELVGSQLADDAGAQAWIRTARSLVDRPGAAALLRADLAMDEGVVHFARGRFDAARASYEAALAELARDTSSEAEILAHRLRSNIGAVALAREDLAHAQYIFAVGLAEDFVRFGEGHLEIAIDFNNLGVVAFRRGDYGTARVYIERAIEIRRRWLGNDHALVLMLLGNLGGTLVGDGDFTGAAAVLREEIAARARAGGEARPEYALALYNLGLVLRELGQVDESVAPTDEALQLQRRSLGDRHPATITTCLALANLHLMRDRPAEARTLLEPDLDALDTIEITPYRRAEFRFAAAQAIAATPAERARADALVAAALAESDDPEQRARIETWRAKHSPSGL